MSEFQENLCELAADLIANGGHSDDTEELIYSLMAHSWRRRCSVYERDPEEQQKHISGFIHNQINSWRRELVAEWPKKAPDADEPMPKTVTEKARANVRGTLQDQFATFLQEASPEEVWLLSDILRTWESNQMIDVLGTDPEIYLLMAFTYTIGERSTYVKVPKEAPNWSISTLPC